MPLDLTAVEELLELEEERLAFVLTSESFEYCDIPAVEGLRDEVIEKGHGPIIRA